MLKPSDGLQGVKDFVLKVVKEAGPNPCPPIIVGCRSWRNLLIRLANLAKKALIRPVEIRNSNPFYAELEEELLELINKLGNRTTRFWRKKYCTCGKYRKLSNTYCRTSCSSQYKLSCYKTC